MSTPLAADAATSAPQGPTRRHRVILLLLLAAIIALSALLGRELTRASDALVAQTRFERETLIFLDRIEGLFASIKDAESALRGHLITAERVFLEDYRRALPRSRDLALELRRDRRVSGPDGADLRNFLTRIESRIQALEGVQLALDQDGLAAATDLLRRQVRSESFGAIREVKDNIDSEFQRRLADAQDAEHQALGILQLAAIGIGANLLLVLALAALVSRQNRQRSEAQTALAALNARMEQQLDNSRRLGEGLERLGRLGHLLQASQRFEEALDALALSLPRMLKDMSGVLYLYASDRSHLESRVSWGTRIMESADVLAADECWALRQGRRHDSGGDSDAPLCGHLRSPANERMTTCLPLVAQGRTLGILHLQGLPEAFTRRDALLEPVTEQIALALSNLELRDSLRSQSIRDSLTGLFNRRYLESSFEREIARSRRKNLGLTLIAFDIDHFKRVNDTRGHAAGDAVLEAFGDLLMGSARKEDLPCRLGGEEFVLLLPETALESGVERAETVRRGLEQLSVEHLGRALGTVTVSAGVAAFPEHGQTLEALLQAADTALYAAKHAGRNRVEAAARVHAP